MEPCPPPPPHTHSHRDWERRGGGGTLPPPPTPSHRDWERRGWNPAVPHLVIEIGRGEVRGGGTLLPPLPLPPPPPPPTQPSRLGEAGVEPCSPPSSPNHYLETGTKPDVWRFRVGTRAGRPSVSRLLLGKVANWVCSSHISVAARTVVQTDAFLRW